MIYKIDSNCSINETLSKMKPKDELILARGLYKEKVVVDVDDIVIRGEEKKGTIIFNSDYYLKIMPDKNECNTFRTYTVQVLGNNVKMYDLTVENGAIPSSKYGQAVALYVAGNNFEAHNISIKSEQDSLFTAPLPKDLQERYIGFLPDKIRLSGPSIQKYYNCDIAGDVDFIFGGATVLFKGCNIYCLNKRGYVAAPSHSEDTKFGYLFYKCQILGSTDEDNSYYLARPWRGYAKCAFIDCDYKIRFNEGLFSRWNDTDRHATSEFLEYGKSNLEVVDFAKKLNKENAEKYVSDFLEYIGEKDA